MGGSIIEIKRKDNAVILNITVYIPYECERIFTFTWDTEASWSAGLLTSAMKTALETRITAIREEAYQDGWRDAKAKKGGKRTWFSGRL